MDAVYELHWQDREHGARTLQLYERHPNGQLSLLDAHETGPFDTRADASVWIIRALYRAQGSLSV